VETLDGPLMSWKRHAGLVSAHPRKRKRDTRKRLGDERKGGGWKGKKSAESVVLRASVEIEQTRPCRNRRE